MFYNNNNNYKMLLFEITVNGVYFYLPIPTKGLYNSPTYYYLAAGNIDTDAMGIVKVMSTTTNFSASVSNGNITILNVTVYGYK